MFVIFLNTIYFYSFIICLFIFNHIIFVVRFLNIGITKTLITSVSRNGTLMKFNNFQTYLPLSATFDEDYETYFQDFSPYCSIGLAIKDGFLVQPYRLRFYPRLQYSRYIQTVSFEGSSDGGNIYMIYVNFDFLLST